MLERWKNGIQIMIESWKVNSFSQISAIVRLEGKFGMTPMKYLRTSWDRAQSLRLTQIRLICEINPASPAFYLENVNYTFITKNCLNLHMKKTLQKINEILDKGVIKKYAIAGGMAQFYYIEPSVTYDLDLIVNFGDAENTLAPLKEVYKWAKKNGYEIIDEHIKIEGVPVQFLPAYNELVKEALLESKEIKLYDSNVFILSAEYLMAILLQTYRGRDKERLIQFFEYAKFSKTKFEEIVNKFSLGERYEDFTKKFHT